MAAINPPEKKLEKSIYVHMLLVTISDFGDAVLYLFAAFVILQGSWDCF